MGFTNSDGSSQRAKEVSHGLKPRPNTSSPHTLLKCDFKVKKAGLDQSYRKETSDNVAETELKVIDIDDQDASIDGFSEDSDYVLLSSGSLSSSLLSSDDSQDVTEFDSFRLSLHHQFSSISLSTGSSDVPLGRGNEALFFDGSENGPKINTSLSREMTSDENIMEDLQPTLVGKKGKGSSVAESETSNSRPAADISSALHTGSVDIPSWNFDRTDIWVSSLDLEEEDSELIQDREKPFDIFDSDFPSPSFEGAMKHLPVHSSSPKPPASVGQEAELNNTAADPDSDEPLFWPFDNSLYSRLDFEKFLCPSPCKVERSPISTGFPASKSTKLTMLKHRENSSRANRKETGVLERRAATAKDVTKHLNNCAQNMASTPSSRLSRSTEAPSPQHQCCISKRRGKPKLKIDVQKHGCRSTESLSIPLPMELQLHDSISKEDSIESMVGLNEFDGHEGTCTDLEKQFTLSVS